MNKIKISNEQERIFINFQFDNVEAARHFFQEEQCIEDLLNTLGTYDDKETEEHPVEDDELIKVKTALKETLLKGSTNQLSEIHDWIYEELENRKK